jgi:hypothetical protein
MKFGMNLISLYTWRAAREMIVARSRDRPNYKNLLHYMLHYTLGSPSVCAA